jgi:hypothetical protein
VIGNLRSLAATLPWTSPAEVIKVITFAIKRTMALSGKLVEFPLPEVLLLIGSRTGRLRLLDCPDFLPMELDVSIGQAHGLHIGKSFITGSAQIMAELGYVVETGEGTFEFIPQPIVSLEHPLSISELVMQLVMRVDEKMARHNAVLASQLFYVLEPQPPIGDLQPELYRFYLQSRQLLASGVRAEDLTEYLGADATRVKRYLNDLHLFGFVKLIETDDVETLREMILTDEISQMCNGFFLAAETSDRMREASQRLHPLAG